MTPALDVIRIKGLKVETVVGVHAWERKLPRTVVVDIELACDVARAARSDALKDAVDYSAVAQVVSAFIGAQQFQLVETLVERLAGKLMADFAAPWVKLELHKPGAVPGAADVSVAIERGQRIAFKP
ncbi:MAG TPA: dihydroneopterin aldolase [Verrucomicrobiae bacterium]|nr:dihydroneopterin aldolase [Verrucomicrobiae bacterium]